MGEVGKPKDLPLKPHPTVTDTIILTEHVRLSDHPKVIREKMKKK